MDECRIEMFEDAMEMVTMISYIIPTLSMDMWQLYARMDHCFDNFASSMIDYLVGVIDNYISRFPDLYLNPPTGSFTSMHLCASATSHSCHLVPAY